MEIINMKTPITYYGGKQTMLKHIIPMIPNHNRYCEPFCGGAAVLFAKRPVDSEVINDLNGELINSFWIAQVYYADLKKEIDKSLHSRGLHAHAKYINTHPNYFQPVERAWAIWALSKMSYSSKLDGSFGYDFSGSMPKKIRGAKDMFTESICSRLENVTIENRNALDVIETYDSQDTFHFVDPPYINSNCGHYEGMFNKDNMNTLLELLSAIKGRFMLTMFPYEPIQKAADKFGWVIHPVERTISASKVNRRKQEEWIVCNYKHNIDLKLF
jgi:DNA adenine methylase